MMMHVTLCDMLASFDPVTKLTWDTIINATLTQDDPSKCQSHADAISDYQNNLKHIMIGGRIYPT